MVKKTALLLSVMICFCMLVSYSIAETEEIELSLPDNFPDTYMAYSWIGGNDTNGATFVITEASCNENEINILISQLPNDSYTSLIVNQTAYPCDDHTYQNEIAAALQ